nr:MAG TPA: hypothetical protein [Caudoviricetes sp.]
MIFSLFGTIAAEDGRQWAVAILFVYKLVYKCWTLLEEVDRYGIFESRFAPSTFGKVWYAPIYRGFLFSVSAFLGCGAARD